MLEGFRVSGLKGLMVGVLDVDRLIGLVLIGFDVERVGGF